MGPQPPRKATFAWMLGSALALRLRRRPLSRAASRFNQHLIISKFSGFPKLRSIISLQGKGFPPIRETLIYFDFRENSEAQYAVKAHSEYRPDCSVMVATTAKRSGGHLHTVSQSFESVDPSGALNDFQYRHLSSRTCYFLLRF
jgi:hypothetical protein